MRQTSGTRKSPGEKLVKEIKRATRKHYSSAAKIRIVLDGLRGEDSIAEVCRGMICILITRQIECHILVFGPKTTSTTQVWFNDNISINQETFIARIRTLT